LFARKLNFVASPAGASLKLFSLPVCSTALIEETFPPFFLSNSSPIFLLSLFLVEFLLDLVLGSYFLYLSPQKDPSFSFF
jgi:hypothetical protein